MHGSSPAVEGVVSERGAELAEVEVEDAAATAG
jgi:hypothetical protein